MAECLEAGDANDGARVASLFTADGVWEATGRLAEFLGTHTGQAAIARRYFVDVHPLSFSAHFLTNESIIVDGDTATGSWRFLQTATMNARALWIAGYYSADFARADGQWRIRHLRIGNLFSTPYEDGRAKTPTFGAPPPGASARAADQAHAETKRAFPSVEATT